MGGGASGVEVSGPILGVLEVWGFGDFCGFRGLGCRLFGAFGVQGFGCLKVWGFRASGFLGFRGSGFRV